MSTLLIETSDFYTARVREENRTYYAVDDVTGIDMLDYLLGTLQPGSVFDHDPKKWAKVVSAVPLRRGVLVTAISGNTGQDGAVVSPDTGHTEFIIRPEHATALQGRVMIVVPPGGRYIVSCLERLPGSIPGLSCTNGAKKNWVNQHPGTTWRKDWVQYSEQFLDDANLKEYQIRRRQVDVPSDGPATTDLGVLTWGAKARRNRWFPKDTLRALLRSPDLAYSLFHLEPADGDQTALMLQGADGVSKTYVVEQGRLPKLQLALADSLSDEEFVKECLPHLEAMCDVQWDSNWCARRS